MPRAVRCLVSLESEIPIQSRRPREPSIVNDYSQFSRTEGLIYVGKIIPSAWDGHAFSRLYYFGNILWEAGRNVL